MDFKSFIEQVFQFFMFWGNGQNSPFSFAPSGDDTANDASASPAFNNAAPNNNSNNSNNNADLPAACRYTNFDSSRALSLAQCDDAKGGYCARGAANILLDQDIPVERGHARSWSARFDRDPRWVKLDVRPEDAPEGAVLCFSSDSQQGRAPRRDHGGAIYGHVEVVAQDSCGNRRYVSDRARVNFGGSVPDNYQGAYVYDPDGSYRARLNANRTAATPADTVVSRNAPAADNAVASLGLSGGLDSISNINSVFNTLVLGLVSVAAPSLSSAFSKTAFNWTGQQQNAPAFRFM